MRKITILLLFTLAFYSVKAQTQSQTSIVSVETNSNYQISEESIQASINYLASDELRGRKLGTEGIDKAATYIEDIFKEYQLKPYFKTYRDSFQFQGKTGYNVVGFKEGSDPKLKNEIIVLGAHYDHIGVVKTVAGDSIANGANDNAAGTTSILELAKYFSNKDLKRSVMFVLFSAEEEGLIGSKHLAKRLKKENANLYALLNFEMIGVPLENTSYTAYLTGYHESNFAEKFNEYAQKEVFGFFPKAKEFNLFKRSDNYPFYEAFKIPSQTLCTFDFSNYEYYHKVGDEAPLMNIQHMKKMILEVIPGIEGMGNSMEKEIQMNKKSN